MHSQQVPGSQKAPGVPFAMPPGWLQAALARGGGRVPARATPLTAQLTQRKPSGLSARPMMPNPYVPPGPLGGQHDTFAGMGAPPAGINQAAFAQLSPQEQQLFMAYLRSGRGQRPRSIREIFAEYRSYRDALNPQHDY